MENMIQKIVDADNEAKEMEKNLAKEKSELNQKIDNEAKSIYDKYMNEALETVKRNNELEERNAADRWQEVKGKQESAHIKLQSDFKNNCDKWVDEIVSRVVG
ncbi:MAG: hypothetical protein Q4A46_05000 [Clostridia bacterium]|nr:hypothetical protein [Clostridia bacterium]